MILMTHDKKRIILYENGYENTSITGGFIFDYLQVNGNSVNTYSKQSNYISLESVSSVFGSNAIIVVSTKNKINTNKINAIDFIYDIITTDAANQQKKGVYSFIGGVSNAINTSIRFDLNYIATPQNHTNFKQSIDISSINGFNLIKFAAVQNEGNVFVKLKSIIATK